MNPREAEERLRFDPTAELWGEHRARYRFALQYLPPGRVLDVACGSGLGVDVLRSTRSVVGMDLDPAALRESRRNVPGIPFVRSDAQRLPLSSGSVQGVTCMETIEHVPDAAALVRELARVLAPDGALVLSTPNRAFGPASLHENNPFHVRELTAPELRAELTSCFDDVQVLGQRVDPHYRFVPFLMVEPDRSPEALVWKALNRLPFAAKNTLARFLDDRAFYPTEHDWFFDLECAPYAHTLVAVARGPRRS